MTGTVKIVLGVVAGLAAGAAVVAVASAQKTPPAPGPGTVPVAPPGPVVVPPGPVLPPVTGARWVATTTVTPAARVRVSLAAADLGTFTAAMGLTPDFAGWQNLLASAPVQQVFNAKVMSAWGPVGGVMQPGPLPADWPVDDLAAATEYHAEFVYGGTAALSTTSLPVPVSVWVAQ
jgi:hypothetical protein